MPRYAVRCYRATPMTRFEVVDVFMDTKNAADARTLARSIAALDGGLPWAPDPDAPEGHEGSAPPRIVLGDCRSENDDLEVELVTGGRPYAFNGTPAVPPEAAPIVPPGNPAPPAPVSAAPAAVYAPREMVTPPPGATTGGPKVALPPYDPAEERRAAGIADLLTMDATGQAPAGPAAAPIGLEPADPKELQNDAPGAHGVPLYEPWRPRGPEHLLNAEQREEISRVLREQYDRTYPGERLKQEALERGPSST